MSSKLNTKHTMFVNWISPFVEVMREKGGSATLERFEKALPKRWNLMMIFWQ